MLVHFGMATETVQWRFAKALQILMTSRALEFGFGMGVAQYKACFVMHEQPLGAFPVTLHMTLRTVAAQGGVVLVILFVATDAILGSFLEQGTLVAFFAIHFAVFS